MDGVLVVDKPLGLSSHALVSRARRALGTRRIGHAGTLDPLATGVLVLVVGEGLKIARYLALDDKRYEARIRLGIETDTLDADGAVCAQADVPELSFDRVAEVVKSFEGTIMQRAPAISALKRGGVPLYASARRGEAVDPPDREVVVHAIRVEHVEAGEIALAVHCGKGFYVRALARDLGRALGSVAHLASLRRVQSGRFMLAQAVDLALLDATIDGSTTAKLRLAHAMVPIERAVDAARVRLDAAGAEHARHGRPIALAHALDPIDPDREIEPLLLCDERGALLALGRSSRSELRVVRGLRCAPDVVG